jgi:hypothetical protein
MTAQEYARSKGVPSTALDDMVDPDLPIFG